MELVYSVVFDYLQSQKYLDTATENQKGAIRNKSKKFPLENGVLFYVARGQYKQRITDSFKHQQIISATHAEKLGGHLGRDKTWKRRSY